MRLFYSEQEKDFIKKLKTKPVDFSEIPLLECFKEGLLDTYPKEEDKPIQAVWLSEKGARLKKRLLFEEWAEKHWSYIVAILSLIVAIVK